jgi:hypothetical protein
MNLWRIFYSLVAIILDMILYETLQRDIGLNLENEIKCHFLGIRDRKAKFVAPPFSLIYVHAESFLPGQNL